MSTTKLAPLQQQTPVGMTAPHVSHVCFMIQCCRWLHSSKGDNSLVHRSPNTMQASGQRVCCTCTFCEGPVGPHKPLISCTAELPSLLALCKRLCKQCFTCAAYNKLGMCGVPSLGCPEHPETIVVWHAKATCTARSLNLGLGRSRRQTYALALSKYQLVRQSVRQHSAKVQCGENSN